MSFRLYPTPRTNLPPPRIGGFIQTFGLGARVATLAVIVDFLAFGGDIASLGTLYVVEIVAAVILAIITYKAQRAWYGDDHDPALIKALIIGLLTAIPVPLTGLIAGPAGILGLMRSFRGKNQ